MQLNNQTELDMAVAAQR
jgi:hypothetical protein